MQSHKQLLTITIPIEAWASTGYGCLLDSVAEHLPKEQYQDGRYPFDREMFKHGLESMLTDCVRHEVYRFMRLKHGRAMVPPGLGGGDAATYYTEKYMKEDFAACVVEMDGWQVTTQDVPD